LTVRIRPERPGDELAVAAVNNSAFGDTKNSAIVDGIRGTDRWIEGGSLVAEDESGLVGHLLLSDGDLELDGGGSRRIWMVGPVAVIPDRQVQGIGSALMLAAIALATERRQPVLCLLGHAAYYPRFGFVPARSVGIEAPKPWRDANWLALPLPDWDASLRGVAHFPPAFGDG
jgi:putative acetyltransferase